MKSARSWFSLTFLTFVISLSLLLTVGCGQTTMSSNSNPGPTPTPTPVVINPGNFVYVTMNNTSTIEGFKIDASGTVVPIPGSPFAVPEGPVGIARNQDFLFVGSVGVTVLSADKDMITTFRIDQASGALTQVASLHTSYPGELSVDPAGKFLYMWGVDIFSIAANGQLSELPGLPLGTDMGLATGPMIFHPNGTFVYSWGMTSGHAFSGPFAISGSFDPATGIPSSGQIVGPATASLAITPDGKFMVANDDHPLSQNQICTYTIDPNTGAPSGASLGGLPVTPVSCSTAATDFLSAITIDRSGAFVAASGPDAVFMFRLSNGTLTPAGTPTPVGTRPGQITFSRDGRYLFAAGTNQLAPSLANHVSVFQFNAANGALVEAPGSPFVLHDIPWRMVQ